MPNNEQNQLSRFLSEARLLPDESILSLIVQSVNVIHHGIFILDSTFQAIFHNTYFYH